MRAVLPLLGPFPWASSKKKLDEFSLEKAPHGGEFVVVHVEYREEFCDL